MTDSVYMYLELLLILLKTDIARISLSIVGVTFLVFCMAKVLETQGTILFNLTCSFVVATIMSLSSYYASIYGSNPPKFQKERKCALVSTNIAKLCFRP
ncbi:hypothetical protein [Helicobacter sp. MIT 01-3238]|uniref:hypothetical protein n=1 Tax=Helicobacter sp. MIT 01-3238 TaxID=398627 RepID=UPI000E1E6828|nr:hypothetical protein [Helicobacter sp. MIT 01-3238]RDU52894.1 hypothetical protein CQA40_06215 [Helicobacter sp. MIT 01-3238]